MNNDLISRQAAIDCVTVGAKPTTIKGRIAELPSAEPRWIPVTERLPEPYTQDILVTVDNGGKYIDVLSYDTPGDGTYEVKWYKTDSDGYPLIFDDVVAWMYMKPWKGGAE